MRFFIASALALLFATQSAFAAPVAGTSATYGVSTINTGSGPNISSSDLSKFYSVSCNNSTSAIGDGNYQRCFKNDSNGGGTNWAITGTKTVKCPGFYSSVAGTGTTGVIFGTGTAVTGTPNTSSAPTGWVGMAGNGAGYIWAQADAKPVWHAVPIIFRTTGTTLYPAVQLFGGAVATGVTLICTEN